MERVIEKCWCGGYSNTTTMNGEEIIWCSDSRFHDPRADGRPKKIKRLYLAGPMSGLPECNYPAFNRTAVLLQGHGFKVVNPADSSLTRAHYVDFLREDLRQMLTCDAVATLEGWWESTGARNEIQVAGLLRMPVRTAREWMDRGVR